MARAPSYRGLRPASEQAERAARGSSKKRGTRPELLLRRKLWHLGCRFRLQVPGLAGRPDIVFPRAKLAIFCDGDFWHGRNWPERRRKLARGHNPDYWIAKIERNMERDLQVSRRLREQGWIVLRFWESEIRRDLDKVCEPILSILDSIGHRRQRSADCSALR